MQESFGFLHFHKQFLQKFEHFTHTHTRALMLTHLGGTRN